MASAAGSVEQDALARRPAPGGRRLDLDVVRGLAILLALGWHFSRHPSGNAVLDTLQWPGRTFGWAGVDLFFVLSGFLVGQLVLREHRRTGRFDGVRFTARRALKLWPVLYVFLAVQVVAGPEPWDTYLWQSALHVQNYAGTSLVHLWSLAVEEHFYLALVVLFPLLTRRGRSPRLFVGLLCGVLVAALALRVAGTAAGLHDVTVQWRTHFRADSLAAGVLLAVVAVHRPAVYDRLLRRRWLWAAGLVLGGWFLATVGKEGPLGQTLGYTMAYLTAAALLLLVHRARWVPRARPVTAPLAALGRYSYGVYIWHIAAAEFVLGRLPGVAYASWSPLEQALKYGSAIVVGVAATLLVERPVLRARERWLPGRTTTPAGTPAVEAPSGTPAAEAPAGWSVGPALPALRRAPHPPERESSLVPR
ncbi:acyltransferase family protein [Geodermatophilus sp. SYSU D00703]